MATTEGRGTRKSPQCPRDAGGPADRGCGTIHPVGQKLAWNIGMVSGLLPVVGVPLPLVSYGGTASVTLLAGFGMVMSLHTHRRLLTT